MIDLSGKYILITGASSGLGRAISQKAAAQGATIVLIARNETKGIETIKLLKGSNHILYTEDIANCLVIEKIIKSLIEKKIKISGFVHSAGIEKTLPLKSSTTAVFHEVFNINVFAGFEFARLLSQKNIVDHSGASFILISSVRGKLGVPFNTVYCASKSALIAGSKAIAMELASKNIRCNCVLPGITETEMIQEFFKSIPPESKENIINEHPLGLGKPEYIASLVTFLLSDDAKWITGADYIIDGGYSIH